ncbi:hypothetical protein ON010_g990 [Phytophthora cinnamomi]|nr:hypothetical protein ON010_g990 [Phytophthora cinnamomi]
MTLISFLRIVLSCGPSHFEFGDLQRTAPNLAKTAKVAMPKPKPAQAKPATKEQETAQRALTFKREMATDSLTWTTVTTEEVTAETTEVVTDPEIDETPDRSTPSEQGS